jgi:hypothetical protein
MNSRVIDAAKAGRVIRGLHVVENKRPEIIRLDRDEVDPIGGAFLEKSRQNSLKYFVHGLLGVNVSFCSASLRLCGFSRSKGLFSPW